MPGTEAAEWLLEGVVKVDRIVVAATAHLTGGRSADLMAARDRDLSMGGTLDAPPCIDEHGRGRGGRIGELPKARPRRGGELNGHVRVSELHTVIARMRAFRAVREVRPIGGAAGGGRSRHWTNNG